MPVNATSSPIRDSQESLADCHVRDNRGTGSFNIISRRSGPRPEDERAKRHLKDNWGTIEKLADTLSGGTYSKGKAKKVEPQARGLIFVDQ